MELTALEMEQGTITSEPGAPPPPGMTLNSYGGYTPTAKIKPEHRLEDQTVRYLIARAEAVQRMLIDFKLQAFSDTEEFLQLLAEKYDAKRGSANGNVTLQSFDGLLQVQVSTGDFMSFGPELQVAKSLIDECLTAWTQDGNDNVRVIINDAFSVGKEGKIRIDQVLRLRSLAIDDPRWKRAMEAISNALRVERSRRYIRFHRRATHDARWEQVSLDMSRVAS